MVDSGKFPPPTDLRSIVSLVGRRRTRAFAFGFVLTFIACTAYIALNPAFGGAPWLGDVVASTNYYRAHLSSFLASASASTASYGSQFSAFISGLLPNSTALAGGGKGPDLPGNRTGSGRDPAEALTFAGNSTGSSFDSPKFSIFAGNSTGSSSGSPKASAFARNSTGSASGSPKASSFVAGSASGSPKASTLGKNSTGSASGSPKSSTLGKNSTGSSSGSPKVSTFVGNSTGSASAPQKASTLARNSTGSASGSPKVPTLAGNSTSSGIGKPQKTNGSAQGSNQGGSSVGSPKAEVLAKNVSSPAAGSRSSPVSRPPILQDVRNRTTSAVVLTKNSGSPANGTSAGGAILKSLGLERNGTAGSVVNQAKKIVPLASAAKSGTNQMSAPPSPAKQPPASPKVANGGGNPKPRWNIETMKKCNLFHGKWVRDESYPMYAPGSCSHIDESFNCFLNGRPELSYRKLRWQPHGCYIPRFNATDMLERLRGKHLVFVGDSLNRNMWESLVCILTNSVKDKSRVFEASGRHEFKTDGSYSFVFKDYNCTVEFFRSVFLVQEWEIVDTSGNEKETLRLDMIAKSSSKYKDADIIVFNTGHWWTHDKTAKGKDYYQEGSHIYNQLNVVDAFHKALNTWAKWVDANVDSKKTLVFFRGYSSSHFRGGQWNSGGQCDAETEPIKEEKYLAPYPPKMDVLESVLRGMKTPVLYLNITRMTDYRKDAHPSIYSKPNLTEDERRAPNRFQDCSHWCLPGVPDSWNDLLYSKLLIEQHRLESLKP